MQNAPAPKLFITGAFSAGKSTIADACIARWPGPVLGYRSKKVADDAGGSQVLLADIRHPNAPHVVARIGPGGERQLYPQVFDSAGAALLAAIAPQPGALVVLDEIGFIESSAPLFQAQVERVLGLPLPVLAVLRQDDTPFLQKLYHWPAARLLTLTVKNRQQVLAVCFGALGLG